MINSKETELQHHQTEEKKLQSQEYLSEQVKELREDLFALAQGLPDWDIMPPDTLIQRRKTSI